MLQLFIKLKEKNCERERGTNKANEILLMGSLLGDIAILVVYACESEMLWSLLNAV